MEFMITLFLLGISVLILAVAVGLVFVYKRQHERDQNELAEIREEFHKHVELYGDKTRLKWGEQEKRFEEMHFKLIPKHLRATTEDVENGRLAHALVMEQFKDRYTRDWKTLFGWYVSYYGDKARLGRGEISLGFEPRVLTNVFSSDYQKELPPEMFRSYPDARIEGNPIPKSCRLSPEEQTLAEILEGAAPLKDN